MLAPHPDDFDAIGVTMRRLHLNGNRITLAVLTGGPRGVPDGFAGDTTLEDKRRIREAEQRASWALFDLPESDLTFLRIGDELAEGAGETAADVQRVRGFLEATKPAIVFLPHGNDSNQTHRRAWALLQRVARETGFTALACLARDPKTIVMRTDVVTPFGQDEADWKAALLRCHRSQTARNLAARGSGLDERILALNRTIAREAAVAEPYAEAFELPQLP